MARVLDQSLDSEVANGIIEALDDAGYTAEEAIPGLILAVSILAEQTGDPEAALDEAANLLADGPTELEAFI